MDIDIALAKLADAPLDHVDLSQIEVRVMRGLAQTKSVIKSPERSAERPGVAFRSMSRSTALAGKISVRTS